MTHDGNVLNGRRNKKRRTQKEIDEEREELRGIYKFHKLPVPDYIAPEIVPDVNFGPKNFYPWLDRKGGRTYAWRGLVQHLV